MEEEGIAVDAVAGTSGGSLVGALYLDGVMGIDELIGLAAKTTWRNIFTPTVPRMGLISSEGIHRFIKGHLRARNIGELKKPFAAVCADLVTGEKVVLTSGNLARAVQASCSLPVIFTPTLVAGRYLIDGGYVNQIPVLAAREEFGSGLVVAVDVNYRAKGNNTRPTGLIKLAMHLTQMVARRNAEQELPHADVVISVDIEGIQLHDIQKHEELVKRGRAAARKKVGEIREKFEALG